MDARIKARLNWVTLYEKTNDAGYVCRHCGISRPTLRKWHKRYQTKGINGLKELSRRPYHSPNQKLTDEMRDRILSLRKQRNLGARRIQSELIRLDQYLLSLATIGIVS